MSTDAVRLPVPARVGQATAVEQTRAAAEVLAAVRVAQECPRDQTAARAAMQESCRVLRLAERAFYKFPRAGATVAGPSVHLARELARVWGNVQYGIVELSRDDALGESEMQAWAWDVQTNTRVNNTFIVKHQRDKRGGPEKLVELRDIYENNANNGARRLREQIFAILPPWFTEEAKDICAATLAKGEDGKTLVVRIDEAVTAFRERYGITLSQLEDKVGSKRSQWTNLDVAAFGVTFRSLERGEVNRDEEFPPARVSAAEITQQAEAKPARARRAPDPAPAADMPVEDEPVTGWPDVAKPAGGAE